MMKSSFLLAILLFAGFSIHAQLGINTNNDYPVSSAGVDVSFPDKGLLMPRVALTDINSAAPITAPAVGLLVYNTAVAGTSPNDVRAGYYFWNGTKWIPVTSPPGTNVGDMQYWNGTQWVIAPAGTNGKVLTFNNGVPQWGQGTYPACGTSFTMNHVAGVVAPVTKTVTYGTVNNIPGEPAKCWITRNLGASQQATQVEDATEASAGWYWQFNRKQGYKHDGTTRTPNSTWINSISEISDWILANDPCALEFGNGWRIPTLTEWNNLKNSGGWINWNGPWSSGLKLHAAGTLLWSNGSLTDRGSFSYIWSNVQVQANPAFGNYLSIGPGNCTMTVAYKAYSIPVRCVRDY